MATRRDVREGFYQELDTAAGTLVDSSNISQEEPNSKEDLPAIVHTDDYRPVPMNNKSAPTAITYDNGVVQSLTFSSPMQARFTLTILAADEQDKEEIYEAVRTHFEDYTYSASHFPDPSAIQADIHHIEVRDSNSTDQTERQPPARGDILLVTLGYLRTRTLVRGEDFETIEEIDHELDVDFDETTDKTYTTT